MKAIKAGVHQHRQQVLAIGSKFIIIGLLLCWVKQTAAQSFFENKPFTSGEVVKYNAYYKWGILMPKAGEATLSFHKRSTKTDTTYMYRLLFYSTGMVESLYSMRDTLESHFDQDMILRRSEKRTNDDNYYSIDKLTFSYRNDSTFAHSLRYDKNRVKIDTTLKDDGAVFDLVGSILFLRSLNWDNYQIGQRIPFKTMIGRDVTKVFFIYRGQEIIERGSVKYRTRRFSMDIYDDAFTDSKGAADLWVGDDENKIPIRIRAKLKIGAAEVFYKESSGLRYPLNCRVDTKKK
jgi:Protein of unknown function (DUF3108).